MAIKEKPTYEPPRYGPKIFLLLAGVMMGLAVLSYAFEEWLYDLFGSPATFVYAITLSVVLALFFLYCYRIPHIGYKLLGRRLEADRDPEARVPSVTYDVFRDELPSDAAMRHHKRREARHMRRRLAREAREARAGDRDAAGGQDRGGGGDNRDAAPDDGAGER